MLVYSVTPDGEFGTSVHYIPCGIYDSIDSIVNDSKNISLNPYIDKADVHIKDELPLKWFKDRLVRDCELNYTEQTRGGKYLLFTGSYYEDTVFAVFYVVDIQMNAVFPI